MKVGFIYDVKEDYGIDNDDLEFCDFTHHTEVNYLVEQLKIAGFDVVKIGSPFKFYAMLKNDEFDCDIIFNLAEGFGSRNRESYVATLCEMLGIPIVGTDAFGLSLTLHKHQTKLLISDIGVATPRGFLFNPSVHHITEIKCLLDQSGIAFPVVLKPNREGTSMGLMIAKDISQLTSKLQTLLDKYNQEILCEEYIGGVELAVPIIGSGHNTKALGIVEYSYDSEEDYPLYTAYFKQSGNHMTRYISFNEELDELIIKTCINIHNYLLCHDISRVDLKLSGGIPYFLEMTPYPGGLGRMGTFEKGANRNNMCYHQLLKKIILESYERQTILSLSKHHSIKSDIFSN